MSNTKIVSDNAAKRSTVTASSSAGTLTADRLTTPVKSRVWRSTSTTATLTITLVAPELLDCFALAFANTTATATVRVQGYATTGASATSIDTTKAASPSVPVVQSGGVNKFASGGAAQVVSWFTPTVLQKLVVTITDTANVAGYIEASCLVIGASWSPKINIGWGASVTLKETTKNERTESGNLRSDRGTVSRVVSFDMKNLSTAERNKMWAIVLLNGLFSPMFVSVYPGSSDSAEEQIHQLLGKLTQQSKLSLQSFGTAQASLELEEI